ERRGGQNEHPHRCAKTSWPRPRRLRFAPPGVPLPGWPDTSKILSWTPLLEIAAPPRPVSSAAPTRCTLLPTRPEPAYARDDCSNAAPSALLCPAVRLLSRR